MDLFFVDHGFSLILDLEGSLHSTRELRLLRGPK